MEVEVLEALRSTVDHDDDDVHPEEQVAYIGVPSL